jgi:hypothetical protein
MTATSPPISPPPTAPEVIRALERQVILYLQLQALATGQGKALKAGDTDALAATLAQRRAIIAQLERLVATLVPPRARWDEISRGLSPAERGRVATAAGQIETLSQAVLQLDGRDMAELRRRQAALGLELRRISQTGSVRHAYRPQSPGPSRFTDGRG